MIKLIAATVLLLAALAAMTMTAAHADVSGELSLGSRNITILTGLFGSTVALCNSNAECSGMTCYLDYDTTSEAGTSFAGWCNATSLTSCYHNSTSYANGSTLCVSSTAYRTCVSPSWSNRTECASGQTCSSGSCTTSGGTTGGGGGSSSSDDTQAIAFVTAPGDFSITQGESATKSASVRNTGKVTLKSVALTISGIVAEWYSISPEKDDFMLANETAEFNVTFSPPASAAVAEYAVILKAAASNASVTASATLKMKVLPSAETISSEIIPEQSVLATRADTLEERLSALRGTVSEEDFAALSNLLVNAKRKLAGAQKAVDDGEFFAAAELQNEAEALLDSLEEAMANARPAAALPVVLIAVIAVIVIAAGFVAYMLMPPKQTGYMPQKGWIAPPQKKKNIIKKLAEKFRRKKKEQAGYEFRG